MTESKEVGVFIEGFQDYLCVFFSAPSLGEEAIRFKSLSEVYQLGLDRIDKEVKSICYGSRSWLPKATPGNCRVKLVASSIAFRRSEIRMSIYTMRSASTWICFSPDS